jgi:hypothetical protein
MCGENSSMSWGLDRALDGRRDGIHRLRVAVRPREVAVPVHGHLKAGVSGEGLGGLWSVACNRIAASKLLEDFTNFRSWREAESSICIQEGPPNKSVPYQILFSGHPARSALPSSNTLMPRQDAN